MKHNGWKKISHICMALAVFVLCLSTCLLLLDQDVDWNQLGFGAATETNTESGFTEDAEGDKMIAQLDALAKKQSRSSDKICVLDAPKVDFGTEDGELLLSFEDFLTGYQTEDTAIHYSIPDGRLSGEKAYVLRFKMRAKDAAAKVNVNFGDEDGYSYALSTEWQTYYYPSLSGTAIASLDWRIETELQDGQQIFLTDVCVYGYEKETINPAAVPNGMYPLSHSKEARLTSRETGTGIGRSMDLIGDGDYIYSVGSDLFRISKKGEDGNYTRISKISNLGTVRHIEWVSDDVVAVAARESGVWFIDISDKENPFIISCYDSLERANDVCFSGNLMFVASRYYGIEIVDISDLENPQFIRRIAKGKECYRCSVYQHYLFVSYWNAKSVDVFDLSAADEPQLVTTIAVDGYCGETCIEDNILYVVTGYHAALRCEGVGSAGYGTGNGLEIYNISDVAHPVWCSTVKTDGSMKGAGYDDWSVEVSNGYAYFTDCFNGTYIYNVSNPYAPERVARLITPIGKDSDNYIDFTDKSGVVFPYDQAEYILSPAMGVYVNDGDIYIACAYSDVHEYSFADAVYSKKEIAQADYNVKEQEKYQDVDVTYALEEYDVYAIDAIDDWYLAGTNNGLILLDNDLVPCDTEATDNAVKDISITADGYIVTAEKRGVGIYRVEDGKIQPCSFLDSEKYQSHVFSVGVTEDGNYAIVQSAWMKWDAIDLHDKENPVFVTEFVSEEGETIESGKIAGTGLMYYRSIVNGTVNGAVGIAGKSNVLWFKSLGDQLQVCSIYQNSLYSETADSAALNGTEMVVQTTDGGYIVYDPLQGKPDLDELTNYKIEGVSLQGIATTAFDRMSLCNPNSGEISIVDISDYENPILLKNFTIYGSPNAALVCEDCVLIPARHDGLLRVAA